MSAPQSYNREAETNLLGACLMSPEIYLDVAPMLHAEDFFLKQHQWVWEAIEACSLANKTIDVLTIDDELRRMGRDREAGGAAFLASLMAGVQSTANAETYAKIVAEDGLRRRVMDAAQDIAKISIDRDIPLDEVREKTEASLLAALEGGGDRTGPQPASKAMAEHLQELTDVQEGRIVPVPTGLTDLDRMLNGGLRRKWMYIIGGRPGMGKSALLQTIMKNAIDGRYKCVAFTLEMPTPQWISRMISHEAQIKIGDFDRKGGMSEEDFKRYRALSRRIEQNYWFVDQSSALTVQSLYARARRIKARYGLDLVVVDYLQLLTTANRTKVMNRVAEIGEVARTLKAMAKELDIVVLAAAQINRNVEGRAEKRPVLADLRESGDIEQEAYGVILMYRDEVYDPASLSRGIAELDIVKHRNGTLGTAKVAFLAEYGRLENAMLQVVTLGDQPTPPGEKQPNPAEERAVARAFDDQLSFTQEGLTI